MHWRRKWQPTPVFLPGDGGAWWAAVSGVAQSRTWLKRLSSSSSSGLIYTYFLLYSFFFPSQLFILKFFESTEKLQEEYTEYSCTLHLDAPLASFVCCLTVLWHFLSLSIMYLFSLNLLRVSCRHHYISPLIIQQVSAKNKNILLHNHSK